MADAQALQKLIDFLSSVLDSDEYDAAMELANACVDPSDDMSATVAADRRHTVGTDTMVDRDTVREIQEIAAAERETGIFGLDSANATYRAAIRRMGYDASGLTGNAARSSYRNLRSGPRNRQPLAADSRTVASRNEMFPNGNRLLRTPY